MAYYYTCDLPEEDFTQGDLETDSYYISFGDTVIHSVSSAREIILRNNTKKDVVISNIVRNNDDFETDISLIPNIIKAGTVVHLSVRFAPQGKGYSTGSLYIYYDHNTKVILITLSGTGVENKENSSSDNEEIIALGLEYFDEEKKEDTGKFPVSIFKAKSDFENVDIVISPKGEGSLLTNKDLAGGGNNSINLQTKVTDPESKAKGNFSVISGGTNNKVLGDYSIIVGGSGNVITSNDSTIIAGSQNVINNSFSLIGIGNKNTISNEYAVIVGGNNNTVKNYNSFIGNGNVNTINEGNYSTIISGNNINITGNYSMVGTGNSITIDGNYVFMGNGSQSTLQGDYVFLGNGSNVSVDAESINAAIVSAQKTNIVNSPNSFIGSGVNFNITNSQDSFIGSGENQQITDSAYSTIVSGSNNFITNSMEAFIGAGQNNIIDSALTIEGEDWTSDGAAILNGESNLISSGEFSSIFNGYNNKIYGTYYSNIFGGYNNTLGSVDNRTNRINYSSIVSGKNNKIEQSNYGIILNGINNTINLSDNSLLGSTQDSSLNNANGSVILGGKQHQITEGQNAGVFAGLQHRNSSKEGVCIGGFRNKLTGCSSLALAGEYGSDFGIKGHVFQAIKDGVNWEKLVVDSETGEVTDKEAGIDILEWKNNNPIVQKGEILLQKMPDPTQGYYPDSEITKEYLMATSKKYAYYNTYLDLPRNDVYTSLYIPENSTVMWDMDIILGNTELGQAIKLSVKDGIIQRTSTAITIVKAHDTICYGSETLNNCDITVELDVTNHQVKFLLPANLKDFVGGAVLRYTIATQDSTDFYWNE